MCLCVLERKICCLKRELNVDEFTNDGTGCFNFPIKFYEICDSKDVVATRNNRNDGIFVIYIDLFNYMFC